MSEREQLSMLRNIQRGHDVTSAFLALFAMKGFQPDLVAAARRRGDVLLVDLPGLLGAGEPVVVPGS
ncbi:hypothetical protein FE391_23120 [Nonomuraea sp. KC401]|uniref:hypothetical protein n=1 Tax=unclassified Nonomuraea TaxID=2593643 RepID=UPI0010FCFF0E|nr:MULTISPECIES: hypothetical protein [unclassified Nonomuraea]NBE95755.1 hypothetical protein [Nonomuraea sp. K271]TLF68141.1 hypothetical protein FE391_23120 [Nonomuraea sp. KC401]